MTDLDKFLDMGGYAAYVWPAYGASFIAIAVLCVISWRWMRRVERIVAAGGEREAGQGESESSES
mgnify:CR=1 FL=1